MSEERIAGLETRMEEGFEMLTAAVENLTNNQHRDPNPGEHHLLHECYEPSPALRGRGKAFTLPLFNGGTSRTFVSWLYSVECYFEGMNFSEERKLRLVESCLRGFALLWYDNLAFSRRMEGKGRIRSWSKLEMKMRLKFLPCSTMDELWTELKTLKQNSLSVIEYAKLFEELHFVCAKEVDSIQMGVRFYYGLKSEISKRINLRMMYPYGELFELALCVERSLARLRKHEVLAETESLEVIETVGKENGSGQGVVKPCLNLVHHESKYIEPESIEVLSYGEEDVSHVPLPTLEEEQVNLNLVQVHEEEQKNDAAVQSLFLSTYMSPLDLYINKRLQKPLSLKMDQFLTSLDDKRCWSSSKNEQGECSYLVPNSKVLNLNPCTRPDTCFKTSCLGGIIVVKLGVEPPWPFGKRYMDSIEKKTGMRTNRGNESAHASSSNVQFSILVAELLSDVPMSPKQAIMVFDPGGRHVISVHEIKIALLIEGCKEIFFSHIQNLRSNSFEPGGVAAGAKARGLSLFQCLICQVTALKWDQRSFQFWETQAQKRNKAILKIQQLRIFGPTSDACIWRFTR